MRNRVVISVHGGLGNQMFLLGLAELLSRESKVVLAPWMKDSRTDFEGKVWVAHYDLYQKYGSEVSKMDSFFQSYTRICFKFLMLKRKAPVFAGLTKIVIAGLIAVPRIFGIRIITSLEIGEINFPRFLRRNYLFLYFQTEIACSAIRREIQNENGFKFKFDTDNTDREVLILHIRRTDYRVNPDIGLLPPRYFMSALELASKKITWDELWVFSDEPQEAVELIPLQYRSKVRIMESSDSNPLRVLALMACGNAFILSNSTFGWWAANLSTTPPKFVMVPEPWFASLDEPKGLIPDYWIRVRV
jgi:hypothetical protein